METQQEIDYKRIAESIEFFKQNFKEQPSLEEAAEHVHLSSFHFQRMFQNWAGVTPKQFLQYLSIEHAKEMLKNTGGWLKTRFLRTIGSFDSAASQLIKAAFRSGPQ